MAIAEHKPMTGIWGLSPQQSPGAETLVRVKGGFGEAERFLSSFIRKGPEVKDLSEMTKLKYAHS